MPCGLRFYDIRNCVLIASLAQKSEQKYIFSRFGLWAHKLLTHWGWVTNICVSRLTIIGSHNGLSPGQRQAIIWTNARILLIRSLGTNFDEMLTKILTFSFMKMHLKVSSAKWRPFLSRPQCVNEWVVFHTSVGSLPLINLSVINHCINSNTIISSSIVWNSG